MRPSLDWPRRVKKAELRECNNAGGEKAIAFLDPLCYYPLAFFFQVAETGSSLAGASHRFKNGEIHQWYPLVWGYSEHLVSALIAHFDLSPGSHLLDPFVGSGTTLVEALKCELRPTGIDANPVAVLAARVKSNWRLSPERLYELIPRVLQAYERRIASGVSPLTDPTYRYIVDSGFLRRGWIRPGNLRRALALKGAIASVRVDPRYREALQLALLSTVVQELSNVRYGPELYCGAKRAITDAGEAWRHRVTTMSEDLGLVSRKSRRGRVFQGDAREVTTLMHSTNMGKADAVICSPPYPAEHDYTRNSRLELAFLESVTDLKSLRVVKRAMIRSHTKNIYANDDDRRFVQGVRPIVRLAEEIGHKVRLQQDGFARYYESVILEYFGGMARHFQSLRGALRRGAPCAYVVGEQASYASIHIPTSELLAMVASDAGFKVVGIERWRNRKSTTTAVCISESILFLRNP